ncbi:MAG TPA: alpha/beta hydrolase [Anaerolineales bacterium]|nr:alpha/beta hydrolase [Anaerolineales bacterium]
MFSLFSMGAGLVAFLLAARWTASKAGLAFAGLVGVGLTAWGAGWMLFGRQGHAGVAGVYAVGMMGLMSVLAGVYVFRPAQVPDRTPQPGPDTVFWALSTGSRLAYTFFPAVGKPHPAPVVYLHGGPGSPIRAGNFDFFRQLTEDGYDVYMYDQVGTGLSDRLPDIAGYTLARNVADLEAIRQTLGVEKLVLIGSSWGGVLAAHYMAAYPNRVEKVVFLSPGVLGDRTGVTYDYSRTASAEYKGVVLPSLRFILAGALARSNPEAAQNFAPQAEMGRVYDAFISAPSVEYQVNCKGYRPPSETPTRSGGANYYVNLLTLQSLKAAPDPRPALQTNPTPALILHGECDYIPREVTLRYKETLPRAEFVDVPNAGHALTSAQPEVVLAAIRAFLLGER